MSVSIGKNIKIFFGFIINIYNTEMQIRNANLFVNYKPKVIKQPIVFFQFK